eukprot:TRINITY_DN2806_c0_g1_i1.p1 TRINITY_DN2806_c0_g1~~TRINITY_DN2806_c0_g1_i1.p1  ORF type:complete len:236 (+),score=48.72 TRINITY_DN2806_c0_g1_i1:125-832(+)
MSLRLPRRTLPLLFIRRSLSSVPAPQPQSSSDKQEAAPLVAPIGPSPWRVKLQQHSQTALAVGGASAILYGGYEIADFFANVTITNAASFGFTTGFVTAFAVSGLAFGISKLFTLNAESAYRVAMKAVKSNREVIGVLGGPLRPGSFKAYSFDNSNIVMPSIFSAPKFKPRQLQILFQVSGSRGHGMVSGEVVKKDGQMQFNTLVVDVLDSGQRIVISGDADPSKAVYQGHIRLR